MFLTKKALVKIWVLTGAYCLLGTLFFIAFVAFEFLNADADLLCVLSVVCFALGGLSYLTGRYSEGKGKLINSGNKLVHRELKPAEFIRLYEQTRDCSDNVLSKPDFDVLELLLAAYDSLGQTEREFEVVEQMSTIASKKITNRVKVIRLSLLYSIGKIDEAEEIYKDALNSKMDMISVAMLDDVTKSDRARALGDLTLAEAYHKQKLVSAFPKATPLALVYSHYILAEIHLKTDRKEAAKEHLEYCAQNGGETKIRLDAVETLKEFE